MPSRVRVRGAACSQRHAADRRSRPLAQQRAARRLDQLGVRGRTLLRHPRAAVDRVPGHEAAVGQGCGFGCPGQGTHICSWQPVGPCRSVDVGRDAFVSTSVVKGRRLSVAKLDCAGPFIATAVLDRSGTIRWESSAGGDKLGSRSAKERRLYSERHSGYRVSGRQSTRGEIPLRIPAVHNV